MKHCVYALIDPRSDELFYIGQTSDLARRRGEHQEGTDQLSGLRVRQIRIAGFVPHVIVLERCRDMASALSAEIFWIELARARGMQLLNAQAVGGYVARKGRRQALRGDLAAMTSQKSDQPSLQAIANARPTRGGRAWSAQEERRIAGMQTAGMSPEAMADALDRTLSEIKRKLKRASQISPARQPISRRRRKDR